MTNEGYRGHWPRALLSVSAAIFGTLLVDVCRAATITVNTQNMAIVFDSQCGLREAIKAVNQGSAYAGCQGPDGNKDRIVVPAGTYTTQQVMDVHAAVTIAGAGREQTIIETGNQHGFGVYASTSVGSNPVTLGLEDLTLRKAQQAGRQAKGIYVEGGVTETAALRLENVRISSYTSDGIRIDSPNANLAFEDTTAFLHGRNCLIENNTYAGIQSVGATSISLEHCRLTKNSGSGMVLVNGPNARLRFSIVDDNTNTGNGGGINVMHDTSGVSSGEHSHFELNHSAVFNNHATGNGGGVYFQAEELAMTHSTISGNTAEGYGGGVYDSRHGANSYTKHLYVTVAFNDAALGGGGWYFTTSGTGTPEFKAALVAKNTLNGNPSPSTLGTDLFTPLQIDATSSVFGTREGWRHSCDTLPPEICTSQPPLRPDAGKILDPKLGPLDYYGGPTPVHPLLPGSPAINSTNAVLSSTCTFVGDFGSCSGEDLYDQRGFNRPGNGNPVLGNKDWDASAFELQCGTGSACEGVTNATLPIAGKLIVTDDWGTGYCMELKIENPNSVPTKDWLANFNLYDSKIFTIWNLNSTSTTGPVTLTPTQDWNRIIAAQGESHSLGFCANRGVSNRTGGVSVFPNMPGVTWEQGVGVRAKF